MTCRSPNGPLTLPHFELQKGAFVFKSNFRLAKADIVTVLVGISLTCFSVGAQLLPSKDTGPQCSLREMSSIQLINGMTLEPVPANPGEVDPSQISIMAYNVENLFDNIFDLQRDDYTYLASCLKKNEVFAARHQAYCSTQGGFKDQCLNLDWNDFVIDQKMTSVAKGILQVDGRGPDILMIEEVENLRTLRMLNDTYLKAAGYKTVELLEGPDTRGIDVGVMSRLEKAGLVVAHEIQWSDRPEGKPSKVTRAIIEVPLKLPNGQIIHVFAVHFPSQSNPLVDRKDAVATLLDLMKNVPAGHLSVAGGDFNITSSEESKNGLFQSIQTENFAVSHLLKNNYCAQIKESCLETPEDLNCTKCSEFKGTEYYPKNKEWSFLDALVFSPDLTNGKSDYVLSVESIEVKKSAIGQVEEGEVGAPNSFDPVTGTGISDHFPIYSVIKLNK